MESSDSSASEPMTLAWLDPHTGDGAIDDEAGGRVSSIGRDSDRKRPDMAALDNARLGTWVINDSLDGWMLLGANGRPVMRADGSRVAFWFRDVPRLAAELSAGDAGAPSTRKPRIGLAALDSGFDRDWDPDRRRAYFADVTKATRLLAYHYAQTTEPEEAARRAVADLLGDPVMVREGQTDAFVPKRHDLTAVKIVAERLRREVVGPPLDTAKAAFYDALSHNRRGKDVAREDRTDADERVDLYGTVGDKFRGRPRSQGPTIFDYLVDIVKGVIGGARDAAQEVLEGIDALAALVGEDPELSKRFALPEPWETQTAGGAAARSVSQFLVGFLPAFKAIKIASGGAALTRVGKFAQAEGAAAIASATVLDPLEERLSNTWQELGLPQNILTDYLAASPDDSEAEGRLKNAIESLALGSGLAGGLALSAKILRAARQAITPKGVIAGSAAGAGLAIAEQADQNDSGEQTQPDSRNSGEDVLLNPYTGAAASAYGFAGSNLSVNPAKARKVWEEANGLPWPTYENGKNYDVHHIKALRDKGDPYDPKNIRPMKHDDHMLLHSENGDFRRWALEDAEIARQKKIAAGEAVKSAVKGAVALITRGKSKK